MLRNHLLIAMFILCAWFCVPGRAKVNSPALPPPADTQGRASVSALGYTLLADQITLNCQQQSANAQGHVLVTTPWGQFTADQIHFDHTPVAGQIGYMKNVRGTIGIFHNHAESMTIDNNGTKHLFHVSLTTCDHDPPHYQLLMRQLTATPDDTVNAKHVTLQLGRYHLFTIPSLRQRLGKKNQKDVYQFSYTAGTSALDGVYFGLRESIQMTPATSLSVDGRLGTEGFPRGSLYYSHLFSTSGNTNTGSILLMETYREDIVNRLNNITPSNLTVSRLPAAQLTFPKIPFDIGNSRFGIGVGAGFGQYHESPTDITATRGQLWGIVYTPALHVGLLRLSGQVGDRETYYPGQTLNAPLTAVSLATPDQALIYGDISFIHRTEYGTSPFIFDRIQIPDELYTEIDFPLTRHNTWRLDVANRQDITVDASRDFTITALYHEDCLTYGISYDTANRGVNFNVWLNGLNPRRHSVPGIAYTQ